MEGTRGHIEGAGVEEEGAAERCVAAGRVGTPHATRRTGACDAQLSQTGKAEVEADADANLMWAKGEKDGRTLLLLLHLDAINVDDEGGMSQGRGCCSPNRESRGVGAMRGRQHQEGTASASAHLYTPARLPSGANTMHVLYSLPPLRSGMEPPNSHTKFSCARAAISIKKRAKVRPSAVSPWQPLTEHRMTFAQGRVRTI